MKKLYLSFAALFLVTNCFAQTNSSWFWATEGSTTDTTCLAEGLAAASDTYGNAYLTGYISDGPLTVGAFQLNSPNADAFVIKYDNTGNVLWAVQSHSNTLYSRSTGNAIAIDAAGNVYMTGYFLDTVSFGSIQLRTTTNTFGNFGTMFLVKYDTGGHVIWAKEAAVPPNSYCNGNGITTDNAGNIYVTGGSWGNISFGMDTLKTTGATFFIVKYDTSGNALWARQPAKIEHYGVGGGGNITSDKSNNIYVTGGFSDTLIIGSTVLSTSSAFGGNADAFIAKYDSNGNALWAKQSNFTNYSEVISATSIAADADDNIYLTGFFDGSIAFGKVNLSAIDNIFLVKFDSSGNAIWGKSSTSQSGLFSFNSKWIGNAVATDDQNHVYIAVGDFSNPNPKPDTIEFGGDTVSVINSGIDGSSAVFELDSSGNVLCGAGIAGGGDDANGLAVDPSGQYIYFGGDMHNAIRLGPDSLPFYGGEMPFMARWNPCSSLTTVNPIQNIPPTILYPNPNDGNFIISIPDTTNNTQLNLYNILGQKIYTSNLVEGDNRITISNAVPGIYIYKIMGTQGEQVGCGKVVVE